jgi:Phage integrase family
MVLPPSLTKMGANIAFPVGSSAQSIISATRLPSSAHRDACLFPARGKPGHPFNGWSKAKLALDKSGGVSNWTLHDLRRTFATNIAQLGIAPHVIERLLNHVTRCGGAVRGRRRARRRTRCHRCLRAPRRGRKHLPVPATSLGCPRFADKRDHGSADVDPRRCELVRLC